MHSYFFYAIQVENYGAQKKSEKENEWMETNELANVVKNVEKTEGKHGKLRIIYDGNLISTHSAHFFYTSAIHCGAKSHPPSPGSKSLGMFHIELNIEND